MSMKEVFFGDGASFKGINFVQLLKDSWMGIALAIILGYAANYLNGYLNGPAVFNAKYSDALVVAVILGMIIRLILKYSLSEEKFFKILPGIILAQIILIPIGIIFYGAKNFNISKVTSIASSEPLVLVQLIMVTALTFVLMYYIGRAFKLGDRMTSLLGFGSAVCGASAIAVTAPICKTEPDDTSTALVINTIAVIISLMILGTFIAPMMNETAYANTAGALLHQTAFVKIAVADLSKDASGFGTTIKAIRVALLILSIPIISYLLNRKLYIPWYMVLFFVAGAILTYWKSDSVIAFASKGYGILFPAALAAVGMNADITKVVKKMWTPLLVVMIVFIIGLGFIMLTNGIVGL